MTLIQYLALTTCAIAAATTWLLIALAFASLSDYQDRRLDKARANVDAVLDGKRRPKPFALLLQRAAALLTFTPLVALLWAALR